MTTVRRRTKIADINTQQEAVPAKPKTVSDRIRDLIKTVFVTNSEMNRYTREHKAARDGLFIAMKEEDVKEATVTVVHEGKRIVLDAVLAYSAGRSSYTVDVAKLKTLVDEETFMKIVTATQTAVKEHVSGSVLKQCLIETPPSAGTENVTVKAAK